MGIIVIVAIVVVVVVSIYYGKTLFQEENPIIMAKSILKLEMTTHEYVKISTAPDRFISNNESKGYTVIKNYMDHLGWKSTRISLNHV
ncbi:hypothetical protein QUF84_15415 [Fictibacillus enclensis]|uniref:hypothetical protein n=1 Tax=Fictibacillus enclensis TaxID=1017270 RepID=UPI0025A18AAA|nr:hypothetical protein [Fictibacillus enclensis]MDM5338600.1 hypothetical protein [Fictibacillus enclensis]